MAKKKTEGKTDFTPIGAKGFGGKSVATARTASGLKLILTQDDEMFGRFLGEKDITDKVADHDPERGRIIYYTFFDGKRNVTLPSSYALREAAEAHPFVQGHYYYLLNEAEVDMGSGRNPMKDISIVDLGEVGDEVQVPDRVDKSKKIVLGDPTIGQLNYHVINYPLK